jgi:DNA-binding GntR family transcriptional regulator
VPGTEAAADLIVGALRQEILSGALAPGRPLRQDELGTRFGVSRIPVREALRVLQAEGLVAYAANKGAVVAGISLTEVLGRLEVRIALESHALRLAIPNMVARDLAAAEEILAAYDSAPDAPSWSEMNWRFHWTLYEPCNCPPLLESVVSNYGHLNRHERMRLSLATGRDRPQQDHHALLDLCRRRDAERAVALLVEHIRATQRSLVTDSRRLHWPDVAARSGHAGAHG